MNRLGRAGIRVPTLEGLARRVTDLRVGIRGGEREILSRGGGADSCERPDSREPRLTVRLVEDDLPQQLSSVATAELPERLDRMDAYGGFAVGQSNFQDAGYRVAVDLP